MPSETKCPKCGVALTGESLAAIKAHVRRCGKTPKSVSPGETIVAAPLPPLPYSFEVGIKISSQNTTQYAHWSKYRAYREKWYTAIPVLAARLRGLQLPWSRWSIHRVYARHARELDYGNFVGGAKPIPDALIRIGAIPDDTSAHFKCDYTQERGSRDVVVITLLETRDAAPK
jgi:hypothetical protein